MPLSHGACCAAPSALVVPGRLLCYFARRLLCRSRSAFAGPLPRRLLCRCRLALAVPLSLGACRATAARRSLCRSHSVLAVPLHRRLLCRCRSALAVLLSLGAYQATAARSPQVVCGAWPWPLSMRSITLIALCFGGPRLGIPDINDLSGTCVVCGCLAYLAPKGSGGPPRAQALPSTCGVVSIPVMGPIRGGC